MINACFKCSENKNVKMDVKPIREHRTDNFRDLKIHCEIQTDSDDHTIYINKATVRSFVCVSVKFFSYKTA